MKTLWNEFYFRISLVISACIGILPTVYFFILRRFSYPTIPVEIADDTLYYLTRIREILAGHIFIGNPYLLEHVHDVTTAFFVGDWIYASWFFVFSLLHIKFIYAFAFSQVFWSVVTGTSLYVLFKEIEIPERYRMWGVTLALLSNILYVWRPVAMSVVFPCFIFFLIALVKWFKQPTGRREQILLVCASTLSFYVYTYLWQIVLIILGLVFLYSIYTKTRLKEVIILGASTGVLSIPVFLYTWKQIHSVYYFETLRRVGLIDTHTIGGAGIAYTLILLVCVWALFVSIKHLEQKDNHMVFLFASVGLLFAGISNVFSGKDLEVAVHIGRFTDICIPIILIYIVWLYDEKIQGSSWKEKIPLGLLFLYVGMLLYGSYTVVRIIPTIPSKEYYSTLMPAIQSLSKEPVVVLANDDIASYIPVLTKDYVLFHPNAELYLLSSSEVEERYLLSRALIAEPITRAQLKVEYRKYAGVGNAVHNAHIYNRKVRICNVLEKIHIVSQCPKPVTTESLVGEEYFSNLFTRYMSIRKDREKYLTLYHVDMIVVDVYKDAWDLSALKQYVPIVQNGRFVIFKKTLN